MRRSMLLLLVIATLILPCALFGLFAYQENVATTRTDTVSLTPIMLADKDVVKETKTTTEGPAIEEKQTTTTTTEKPAVEKTRTTTKTKTETKD